MQITFLTLFLFFSVTFSYTPPSSLECARSLPPPLSPLQRNIIFSLTNIAENSQTNFAWTYAENIHDGRGITFGIIGFTSGTYDGTIFLRKLKELDPTNELVKYLPAFEAIDKSNHTDEGLTENIEGLENFINDFNIHGADPLVKLAQLSILITLYWEPTIKKVFEIGCQFPLTVAELYDICINHGETGEGTAKGLVQLVQETNDAVGSLSSGVKEEIWLNKLYDIRKEYLMSDETWLEAVDRVEMHRSILISGNVRLVPPIMVSCYGDNFTITGEEP